MTSQQEKKKAALYRVRAFVKLIWVAIEKKCNHVCVDVFILG